ncbi:MAG: glutamate synthase large subunit [Myxococcota bacterium]
MGFVAQLQGHKSRQILLDALHVLERLSHRAAAGADAQTGDGAGVLLQLPHRFFKRAGLERGFDMPRRRRYAVGQLFLPLDPKAREACERIVEQVIEEEGQRVIGWRDVPVDIEASGPIAREVRPAFRQIYVGRRRVPPTAFQRVLYVIRKRFEERIRQSGVDPEGRFHCASLSAETIVYKGLLQPSQLFSFYEDLRADDMVTAIALVHSRFSTNTFPTWDLAQPFHYVCHNGEINTLRGNRNWTRARRSTLQSAKFPGGLERLGPLIVPGTSDSAQFDNMLELLHLGGRSLPQAMMMMIPEAWRGNPSMPEARRDFYRYTEALIEPWDGPAAMAFTDGTLVGATLDRNGLRPARYLVTDDDRVVLASETGVIDISPERVRAKGRLQPGRMLVIDTEQGRILRDDEVKADIVSRYPYGRWLAKNVYEVDRTADDIRIRPGQPFYGIPPFPDGAVGPVPDSEAIRRQQLAFGYTDEDIDVLVAPMARDGAEPIGAMGNDAPLACLSDQAPPLPRYFHQLFAQVTNPPIDPIREAVVMSLATALGPGGNTFEETPEQCHVLQLESPILTNEKLEKIANIREGVFESVRLDLTFDVAAGPDGLEPAIEALCEAASARVDEGMSVLILSDRAVDADHAPIPALLAVSAVHQHLVREGSRLQVGLVLETAEAREVHDFACLLGYGVGAINPYLALDTVHDLVREGRVEGDPDRAVARYVRAVEKGLLKVLSKMGISTLTSYRGAQIFEAVGLDPAVIDRYFTGTPSRIGGLDLADIGREALTRHDRASYAAAVAPGLPTGGDYRWRRRGERHKWTPSTITALQQATRVPGGNAQAFERFCALVDEEDEARCTLRGLLEFDVEPSSAIPLGEVEPVEAIARRFVTGAMSFGSLSPEAHETLAIAMNRLGGRSNSGEGGEEPHRFFPDPDGTDRGSRIKQVASGRFGVTAHYLVNANDLQIKMAQGAKPGEGGQLPGHKVDVRIARVRHSTPGVSLISPPPHHDIYSIEDLAQLIYDLQAINPDARVSVKLVSEVGVGTVAAGVAKAYAGCVVIAGMDGGTGASPLSSLKRAGLPWELGLSETHQVLTRNRLRDRIRVQVDGGIRTGRDLAIATLLGAEEWGVATAALVVEGCILLRKCHKNTCSVGIATQNPALRARFAGSPDHVVTYFTLLAEHLRSIMAKLGFRTVDEMVGRVDRLRPKKVLPHEKAATLDLQAIIAPVGVPEDWPRRCATPQRVDQQAHLDHRILEAAPAPWDDEVRLALPIRNVDRAVGTRLSGEVARLHGANGLPEGRIDVTLTGSAGQSFGAFLSPGITLRLIGDGNDYVGKGLCGGIVAARPPEGSPFAAEDQILVGNVVLYGATFGQAYINGRAGERFAVRNSGAVAVVEGTGDHACEYMTGGTVVILGRTGRNFGAGMSGGFAYVYDVDQRFRERCNLETLRLDAVSETDWRTIIDLIAQHVTFTGSSLGKRLLEQPGLRTSFVKVVPLEYERALRALQTSTPVLAAKEDAHGSR